ncbi:MAG: GNAT family N-acetyltransferase [Bacillota bacterium]
MILPTIKTDRLFLRPLKKEDAKAIYAYAKYNAVGVPAGWMPHASIKDTEAYLEYVSAQRKAGQPGPWAIVLKESKTMIGTIEIHSYKQYKGELGFVLHPDYHRQGYMFEACKAVMVCAFEQFKIKRLSYMHFLDNKASEGLRKKLGFTVEGIKRKGFRHEDGRILDEVVASFTDDDYQSHFDEMFKAFKKTVTIKRT